MVEYAKRNVPGCQFNKAELWCPGCKGFKNYGICSHVCAVNHSIDRCDVRDALAVLSRPRRPGGFRSGVRPALMREDCSSSSDSSEDEPLAIRFGPRGSAGAGPSGV